MTKFCAFKSCSNKLPASKRKFCCDECIKNDHAVKRWTKYRLEKAARQNSQEYETHNYKNDTSYLNAFLTSANYKQANKDIKKRAQIKTITNLTYLKMK